MSVQNLRYVDSIDRSGMIFVPITSAEEKAKIKKELTPILMDHFQRVAELKGKIAENNLKIQAADRTIEAADHNIAKAQRMNEEGDRMIAEGDRKIEEARCKQQEIIVTLFYRIFYGNKQSVPPQTVSLLFTNYLNDGSISFDKDKSCFKINSMKGVVSYLKDHAEIKQCDLRSFKAEIQDIQTLAKYLKNSAVRAIAINNGIAEQAKTSLAQAVAARNGGLRVQYFA